MQYCTQIRSVGTELYHTDGRT